MLIFAGRNAREILRDPLNLVFGLGFPVVLLLLLSAIQANVPVALFEIEHLAPGITVFGLAFMTLFSATLIAKDRQSAFLMRLYTTPLKPYHFILGYMVPILPISIAQTTICYIFALALGLELSGNILLAIIGNVPVALLYVAMGLLFGSILSDKQVGGICGALLTNLTAWLSGVWFDLELVGGAFQKIANILPFVHAVEMERCLLSGNTNGIMNHLFWVIGYTVPIIFLAVYAFLKQSKN